MTGLDKIIGKIKEDSAAECASVIDSAKAGGEAIIAQGEKAGRELAEEIIATADAKGEQTVDIAESSASQIEKQSILTAKVELINEVLSLVPEKLKALPEKEYFDVVIKLACEYSMPGKCCALLSEKDRGRMPADFESRLTLALKEKGAECTLSDKASQADSGIILDYGNILVDCSFEAIVEENADDYKAIINNILFRR